MGQLAILRFPVASADKRLAGPAGTSSICLLLVAGKTLPVVRTTQSAKDSQQATEAKGLHLLGDAAEGVSEALESCPSCNQLNKYLPQKRIKARE